MDKTLIDSMYDDFCHIVDILGDQEISLKLRAEENFTKTLLLASASYFENSITSDLKGFTAKHSQNNLLLTQFLENKAICRQYHQFFNWEAKNANQFFGLFGEEFKNYMKDKIKKDSDLQESIEAFMEIGSARNRLVHQNFASFTLEKTIHEVYKTHQKAVNFVTQLNSFMDDFCCTTMNNNPTHSL